MRQRLGKEQKSFQLVVKRLDPDTRAFVETSFPVEADRFTSVLDILISVKERQDHTLSMRYSCNMGICGSCGMVINGKPRLACETAPGVTLAPAVELFVAAQRCHVHASVMGVIS